MSEALKLRRLWLQFSLRDIFLIVTVLSAFLAVSVHRAERQHRAVARLKDLGAVVSYDYRAYDDRDTGRRAAPRSPLWLRNFLGIDYFDTAHYVCLERHGVDQHLAILKDLPYVDIVRLDGSGVTDEAVIQLQGLNYLRVVTLANQNATDQALKHLQPMTQLQVLHVGPGHPRNHVTNAGVGHLARLKNLRHLYLTNAGAVTDDCLVHLEHLTNLRTLRLEGTSVTEEGVARLQAKLPNCRISWQWGGLVECDPPSGTILETLSSGKVVLDTRWPSD